MITKVARIYGEQRAMSCDGRCDKAFGINGRPKRQLSDDDDDYVFKPDSAVGIAPPPGRTVILFEGECAKPSATPITDPEVMNKWCLRECERSEVTEIGEPIVLPDMENPTPNMPWLHRSWEGGAP